MPTISGDFNNDFNNDFSHSGNIFIGSAAAGDVIDYFFEFPSRGDAQRDLVIGPYFLPGIGGLGPDVLIFDRTRVFRNVPLLDYWCMVTQKAPLNNALLLHPNVQLVINRTRELLGESNVILNFPFVDVTQVAIMLSGIGQHTDRGLFGVQQSTKPTPVPPIPPIPPIPTGYITEDATQTYVAEDGTTVYVPEP